MQIRARMSMSADGYVTTPGGWPALTADPAFVSGESHGIREFLAGCEAALMGRTTFEPALANDRWPWPNLDVFVLGSQRPSGTPDHDRCGDRLPPSIPMLLSAWCVSGIRCPCSMSSLVSSIPVTGGK